MIKYALRCADDHRFEGWFSSSADYDRQKDEAVLSCPVCGSDEVSKAPMAPAIARGKTNDPMAAIAKEWNQVARKAKAYVEDNFENVGKNFPDEARKQHHGEVEAKPIYGEASPKDVKALKEEGVGVAPVPQPVETPAETKKKLN